MTDAELFARFESLGDNCEFGIVQRQAGVEPLGFFRFNFASFDLLLQAFAVDFAGIDAPEQIEIGAAPDGEWIVRLPKFGFAYHTHQHKNRISAADILAQQLVAVRFLRRKLVADLASAEKIFVRKGESVHEADRVRRLHHEMRRFGPATLLWVVPHDDAHAPGTAEVCETGLLRGYIDRFASYIDAQDVGDGWRAVCRAAFSLDAARSPPGEILYGSGVASNPNLVRHAKRFGGHAWITAVHAESKACSWPVAPLPGYATMRHTLLQDAAARPCVVMSHAAGPVLQRGDVYVLYLDVWVDARSACTFVGVQTDNLPCIAQHAADMSIRDAWQRLWAIFRVPVPITPASPALAVQGCSGVVVYSACWGFERIDPQFGWEFLARQ